VKKIIISSLLVTALTACEQRTESVDSAAQAKQENTEPSNVVPAQTALVSGIELANLDEKVRPQDDLFRYVNGAWLDSFEIPADKSNYGAFTKLAEQSKEDVKKIIESASQSKAATGTDEQKVGDLYKSFMDQSRLDSLAGQPLVTELDKIDAIRNTADLSEYLAYAQMMTGAPFYAGVGIDSKDPSAYITQMGQSGLGLPNRDFYLKEDDKSNEIRQKYVAHIETMFALAQLENSADQAQAVMALETLLAQKQWPKEKLRDPIARYNKLSSDELYKAMPQVDWKRWHSIALLESMQNVIVAQPDYLTAVNALFESEPIDTWKAYFKWRLITKMSPYLSANFEQEDFRFYRGVLSGVEAQEPRWKRGVGLINSILGEVVGKIYVTKHFKPQAKDKMVSLVENLRSAYGAGIDQLEWMGVETKEQAKDKLAKFAPKIGYPDQWKDYSDLMIDANDLFGNVMRATTVEEKRNRARLGKPVDRFEWFMTPQTVNAYYNPVFNEIVFPAAILQPPFFNLKADAAVNYGAIGAVIGHEMGHGFDDSGSQYDGDGRLRNWWTDQDRTEFEKRTNKLVTQFDQYKVLDGLALNGEFTQGENIGDLSGLTIAYKAYKRSLNGQPSPVIDGLTGEQRVFVGWAQVWARKYRDEELRRRISTDPHSPSEFRANGTVRNMPEFYQAFEVKPEDKMYLEKDKRVKIW